MYNNRNYKNNRHQGYSKPNFTIDIEKIYRELKAAISDRCEAQEEQKRLWSYAHRGYNVSTEMSNVNTKIGNATHRINGLLSQLSHVKKYHKAMNMAHGYLTSEIERLKKIIAKFERQIDRVAQGRSGWVNAYGVHHHDNTEPLEYVGIKKNMLAKLERWDEHVSRYLA